MRSFAVLLAAMLFPAGCATPGKSPGDNGETPKGAGSTPEIRPIDVLSGRVVRVNEALRFVVIDFGVSRMPQPEQRLDVYRQGKKVGEVRVSNQARAGNVAADITAGEAALGDEVRDR